ncbi:unnamed protein product [Camellia sinensis]
MGRREKEEMTNNQKDSCPTDACITCSGLVGTNLKVSSLNLRFISWYLDLIYLVNQVEKRMVFQQNVTWSFSFLVECRVEVSSEQAKTKKRITSDCTTKHFYWVG